MAMARGMAMAGARRGVTRIQSPDLRRAGHPCARHLRSQALPLTRSACLGNPGYKVTSPMTTTIRIPPYLKCGTIFANIFKC
jgi:hypothetical protein